MSANLERCTSEQRVLLFKMASAHQLAGEYAQLSIEVWSDAFSGNQARAILETIAWLVTVRESLGLQGYGRA